MEIRLARSGETTRQKEIWKLCFEDSDQYINFFYDNRYREEETMVLLQNGEIQAMLTMIPVTLTAADARNFPAAMLYAIATHPEYQHRGLSTRLIDFTGQYLRQKGIPFSVLVPAGRKLFDFYAGQGYQRAFYIREVSFTRQDIESLPAKENCRIEAIDAEDFNRRRKQQLRGQVHISYSDRETAAQRLLSQQSGADIYGIDTGETQGCAVIERLNTQQALIKELLVPDEVLPAALKAIAEVLPVEKYTLRTPVSRGQALGGRIRPFGMLKVHGETGWEITSADLGYLGLAFD